MSKKINIMWYSTDSTGAIMQLQEDRRWHTLEYLPPCIAEKEVERRNAHLRQVYADNGVILS